MYRAELAIAGVMAMCGRRSRKNPPEPWLSRRTLEVADTDIRRASMKGSYDKRNWHGPSGGRETLLLEGNALLSPSEELILVTKYKGRPGEIGALMDRLDEKIETEDSVNDYRTTAAIAADFCELLLASLDANQKDGLMAAHAWWDNSDAEAHKKFVSIFAKVIDLDRANGVPPRQAAINRLVWTALNVNGRFCAYMAEFLADLGRGAGLTAKQMTDVFAKYVPGL